MAEDESTGAELARDSEGGLENPSLLRLPRSRLGRILAVLAALALIVFAAAWIGRRQIAENVIADELAKRGIAATYAVESIGARRQVVSNVVVGDPGKPDLTIRRAEVTLRYRLGFPTVDRVTLFEPRLYGAYRNGRLSLGSLDSLLFGGPKQPFKLPELDLAIRDGRARIDTDYGPLGLKAEGNGQLSDGFDGIVAAVAPSVSAAGCTVVASTVYGKVQTRSGKVALRGPLRIGALTCPERKLALENVAVQIDGLLDRDARGGEADARLVGGSAAWTSLRAGGSDLRAKITYRGGALIARLDGALTGIATPMAGFGRLASEGTLRARPANGVLEYRGSATAAGLRLGTGMARQLADLERSTSGTLLAPLIARFQSGLSSESRGSRLEAELEFKRNPGQISVVVPQATLVSVQGSTLAAVSRFSLVDDGGSRPRIAGNFSTAGRDLPRLAGRMETFGGQPIFRLAMAEFRRGDSALTIPRVSVAQARDGTLGFAGVVRVSGPVPGGAVQNLSLPLDGSYASDGNLAVLRRCTSASFDRVQLSSLVLQRRSVVLCPQQGAPILQYRGGSLRLAAGVPNLEMSGMLGGTPIRLTSGPVGFAYPGSLSAKDVAVALGPAATASRFRITELKGRLGARLAGTFAGADVKLAATPLDLLDASGDWEYHGNRLQLANAGFRLVDRLQPARFSPLSATGARLTLADNRIDATAELRHAASGRAVSDLALHHDLGTGRGFADLNVGGLRFDKDFQPTDLSELAKGTIALANGAVSGTGRIEWNGSRVTSRGRFSTERLDFAAAFGPVSGLSGTVEFTDLLGLVTAPDQEVRIASLNPGIEVTEGVVRFQLEPGMRLVLRSASWPFLGGRLSLAPTTLNLGVSEARRYTLVIDGLDAARFIERMGLANLQATGIFDGELPLVFSAANPTEQVAAAVGTVLGVGTEQGVAAAQSTPGSGRIVNGHLRSRPPGGNVSYIGELTYRDLSAMANFAFQTLRSLDYRTMDITLNGSLEGEIVTNVRFDGVRQGAGAKKNFLTRAVADLPIQMNVNIRAPFYQLITSFKALYDPAFVKDPRDLGLIDASGRPIERTVPDFTQPGIQPSESEKRP